MTYELALISVVIGAGYWGVFFVRQRPHGTATFGIMLLAAAGLSGLGLLGRRVDAAWLGVAGAVGAGAGGCLLVLGPVVRGLARRLVAAERIGLATRLFDVAELLAPGSGVAEEKALLRAMVEIREGRIEQTVEALTAAKQRAPGDARLAIDERIAMLYLTAYRWRDAIAHAEAHLFGAPPPTDGEGSLRAALGLAPPVWVELLGAYGRVGELEQAARMLARLEDVCAGRDDAGVWIHRARVMFLALAGRAESVRALISPRRARNMSSAARTYWMAVAYDHSGDREAAAAGYAKARVRARGRPRALIDQALARLSEPKRPALAPLASEVAARVEAAPLPPQPRVTRATGARATWGITAVLLAVSAVTSLVLGDTQDLGVLTRAGALLRGAVASGEWWRLVSCVFVHVGALHLVLNATAMVVLGRLAEDLFGSSRAIAVFGLAGLAGSVASYLASPAGISAGASGAVFGLLGAVFVELTWHRQHYRAAWKRGMWGGLAVVTVGQLGYGFLYPVIDQWAHGAGLAAGAVLAIALSPNARWARAGLVVARALALGFAVLAAVAAVQVVRTPLEASLFPGKAVVHELAGLAITAPASWGPPPPQEDQPGEGPRPGTTFAQPDGLIVLTLVDRPRSQLAQEIEDGRKLKDGFGEATIAREPLIALPSGWEGTELEASAEDAMGYHQRLRVMVCHRAFGDSLVLVTLELPDTVARALPGAITALLGSVGPR